MAATIMRIEDQVVSLELAKKLKELGVKQESYFYWVNYNSNKSLQFWHIRNSEKLREEVFNNLKDVNYKNPESEFSRLMTEYYGRPEFFSALTVSELGEKIKWKELHIFGSPDEFDDMLTNEITQADFYAKVLIYILENKHSLL
jgi:hypothetical protein